LGFWAKLAAGGSQVLGHFGGLEYKEKKRDKKWHISVNIGSTRKIKKAF